MTTGLSTAPNGMAGVHGFRLSARHSASKTRVNALKARSGQDDIGFVPPLIPAQAGIQSHELRMCGSGSRLRGDERMGRSPRPSICISVSTHHSHNTFPLRGSVIAALLILLLPAPVKGGRSAEKARSTIALARRVTPRLRGVYRTDSKPVRSPPGAPPGGFGDGCRTSLAGTLAGQLQRSIRARS